MVVTFAFLTPPALRGLAALHRRPGRITARSWLAAAFVKPRLPVQLFDGEVLVEAQVWIVCSHFVGVVIAVFMRVNHQRSIQVGLHIGTDVAGIVHLRRGETKDAKGFKINKQHIAHT